MAFGFDERQIDHVVHAAERRRRLAMRIVVATAVITAAAIGWGWWSVGSASGVGRTARGMVAPVPMVFEEVAVDRTGGLFSTGSWEVTFSNVRFDLPGGGTATIDRLVVPWVDLADARIRGHHQFAKVDVTGFSVRLPSQPLLVPFVPSDGVTWTATEVLLADGTVEVAADGPRRAARVEGISGRLEKVRYDAGARLLGGQGDLRADRATIGTLAVDAPAFHVVARDSTIGFEGQAGLLGSKAAITAQIEHVHQGAALKVVVEPQALSIEDLVSAWTGSESPLHGPLAGKIIVRAGGDLPRGAPVIETEGTVPGARLALGPPGNAASKAVKRFVPTLTVDKASGDVLLPDLVGGIALEPDGASVLNLIAGSGLQTRVRGPLAPEPALLVRTVSPMDWWANPGRGVIVSRDGGAWAVRAATRAELLPPAPAPGTPAPAPGTPAPPAP